jgi:hypothetical protein
VVHTIDRWVEVFELDGIVLRLEGYPDGRSARGGGEPAAIERVIAASGIAREEFWSAPLAEFVRRFESAPDAAPASPQASGACGPGLGVGMTGPAAATDAWAVPELGPSLGRMVVRRKVPKAHSAPGSTTSACAW